MCVGTHLDSYDPHGHDVASLAHPISDVFGPKNSNKLRSGCSAASWFMITTAYVRCEAPAAIIFSRDFAVCKDLRRVSREAQRPESSAPSEVVPPDPPGFSDFLDTSRVASVAGL